MKPSTWNFQESKNAVLRNDDPLIQKRVVSLLDHGQRSEIVTLYRSLSTLSEQYDNRVFLFVAANAGDGTSTIVASLAQVASEFFGRNVLIVNATMSINQGSATDPMLNSVGDTIREETESHFKKGYRSKDTPVVNIVSISTDHLKGLDVQSISNQITAGRNEFDLVLIDCPALSKSDICLTLAPMSDGAIVVLEADRTRVPVLDIVVSQLAAVGGRVLGAVLNKRRYYIPQFLYNLL